MFKIILDKFFMIIKKFIYCLLVIYAFNMILYPTGFVLPMNFFIIIAVMLCGFPAIIGFSLFFLIVM